MKKRILSIVVGIMFALPVYSTDLEQPQISIIIDDMGHNWETGLVALSLPGPVTYAFLPFRLHASTLAEYASRTGKEVMVHIPMSSTKDLELGEGQLNLSLNEASFKRRLKDAIALFPNPVGINNHMGSQLTQKVQQMAWTMEVLKQRNLFFIDSRTTHKSIAWNQARKYGIATLRRDVFLDHEVQEDKIREAFIRGIWIAKQQGSALIIGHPHSATIKVLRQEIPKLIEQGVQLVPVSELMMHEEIRASLPFPNRLAYKKLSQ